jgi:hypothetical protein
MTPWHSSDQFPVFLAIGTQMTEGMSQNISTWSILIHRNNEKLASWHDRYCQREHSRADMACESRSTARSFDLEASAPQESCNLVKNVTTVYTYFQIVFGTYRFSIIARIARYTRGTKTHNSTLCQYTTTQRHDAPKQKLDGAWSHPWLPF